MPAVTVLEDGARRRLIMNLTQVWTTYMVLGYSMRICLSKKKKKGLCSSLDENGPRGSYV